MLTRFLVDRNGRAGVTAQIDLHTGEVSYCDTVQCKSGWVIATIDEVTFDLPPDVVQEVSPDVSPRLRNIDASYLTRIMGANGEYWTSSGNMWTDDLTFDSWEEESRDVNSVHLKMNGRNGIFAQIDLHAGKVVYCDTTCFSAGTVKEVTFSLLGFN